MIVEKKSDELGCPRARRSAQMKRMVPLFFVSLVALLIGCATTANTTISRHFGYPHPFGGGTYLDLNGDHTFMYSYETDVVGDYCVAKGTWTSERRDGVEFVAIRVNSMDEGEEGDCGKVTNYRLWLLTHGGIVSVGEYIMDRKPPSTNPSR